MVNPQAENGHTDIANEILEALAKTRIPGEARQLLDFILRKTYGWNKLTDDISLSQICQGTGLNKVAVIRARKKLLSMNIISVIQKDNKIYPTYCFNKYYNKWKPLAKKITLSKKQTSVIEKANKPLAKKIPTKETNTKETNTKEKAKRKIPISQKHFSLFLENPTFINGEAERLNKSYSQVMDKIQLIKDHCASTNKKYYDLPATLRNWFKNDFKKKEDKYL